jgi:amino acid transporter
MSEDPDSKSELAREARGGGEARRALPDEGRREGLPYNDAADAADLQRMGYMQELLRDMGGFSNFAISFSVISILTGIPQFFGYGLKFGGPSQMVGGWWLVSIFTMTVAMAMAELASAYPTSGALYHWSTFLGGRSLGWFTACLNAVGQFAVLAGIDYGLSVFIVGATGLPNERYVLIPLYAALLFSHALLNHIGIHVVSLLNNFSAWYHIGVVALILGALALSGFVQPVSFLAVRHAGDGYSVGYSFVVGLLLSQWTLSGYDASANVSEETHNPRKTTPWGIFLAVAISVVFGSLLLAAVTLSVPDLEQAVTWGDSAWSEILKARLGVRLGSLLTLLSGGAMWMCGLAAMTSASRMIYAFARDGGLPWSKGLATISPKHRTPSNAIWTLAVLAMGLVISVSLYSAVVSVATLGLYCSYGLPIAARLFARAKGRDRVRGPWQLGGFSTINAAIALGWIFFIVVVFVLPPNDAAGRALGGVFVFLVVVWLLVARRRFKGPKLEFAQAEFAQRDAEKVLS